MSQNNKSVDEVSKSESTQRKGNAQRDNKEKQPVRSSNRLREQEEDEKQSKENKNNVEKSEKVKINIKPAADSQKSQINEDAKKIASFYNFEVNKDSQLFSVSRSGEERIIIVLDRNQDENVTNFIVGNQSIRPLDMLKKQILIFIKLKLSMNAEHTFALMVLSGSDTQWLLDFTNDLKLITQTLNKIDECDAEDIFDFNLIFDDIIKNIPSPHEYLLRTVIFYSRSYTVPKIELSIESRTFLENPYHTLDVLYTHEPISTSNNCIKIFETLQKLDPVGTGYFLPVCRDVNKLNLAGVKLLGHPLQRPVQKSP